MEPKYLGDPINAVRIFNEKEVDELIVLDIDATVNKEPPNFSLIAKLAAECRMPLCYGGGVVSAEQASRIIDMGVEKVAVSAAGISNPAILTKMSLTLGCQSVVAVLDLRRSKSMFSRKYEVFTHNALIKHKSDAIILAKQLEEAGAGEIIINSIDRDGQMQGYDLDMAKEFKRAIKVPVTFLGGAGTLDHLGELIRNVGIAGIAAGSLFVFKGKYRAVLINYPSSENKLKLYNEVLKNKFLQKDF
jgi:cyclase